MEKILQDKKILITRERKQAKAFSEKIMRFGGIPIEVPLLKISCKEREEDKTVFQTLSKYKWIFFTSANGVECFFQLLKNYKISSGVFKHIRIAVVGHKTEEALKNYGYHADFIPTIYSADQMVNEFVNNFALKDPFLLVRGNRSRNVLPDFFSRLGIEFDTVEVYETLYNDEVADKLNDVLMNQQLDFITFTSPSTVDAFIKMRNRILMDGTICVCIGTTTQQRATEAGFNDTITPDIFTIEGMVNCMKDYIERIEYHGK